VHSVGFLNSEDYSRRRVVKAKGSATVRQDQSRSRFVYRFRLKDHTVVMCAKTIMLKLGAFSGEQTSPIRAAEDDQVHSA
jgi:hypothetical protein